jgi:hypothetical protein
MEEVIIIGGGIAGLTAAHELLLQNYKVTLLERNADVGGIARTYQNEKNKTCPYEYSWRAFGSWYQNVYQLMKQIPYNNHETVYDKLTILQGGKKTCDKKIPEYQNTFSKLPYSDILKTMPLLIQYVSSCDERNIRNFSGIGLRDYIKEKKASTKAENLIGKIVGPYLGFDYHNASVYDLLYGFEMMANNSDSQYNFNILSLPTNHAWFEPWIRFLQKKGLKCYTQTEVKSIHLNDEGTQIKNIVVNQKSSQTSQKTFTLSSKYYVNCTGPEVLAKLFQPYLTRRISSPLRNWIGKIEKVAQNGRQIQMSIYYYLDKKIYLDNANTLAYLPNTPWLLMVLSTGHIWGDNYLSKYCKPGIKEVMAVGICEPYVAGELIKKPWSQCSREEIKKEAWYQLIHDKDFVNNICIEDNTPLRDVKVLEFTMWDSYIYKNGSIDTYEPKWANNVNTRQYRPEPVSPLSNLFIGGSYTNTSTGIFSMESAAESGKRAALALCNDDHKRQKPCLVTIHRKSKFPLSNYVRNMDCILYKWNISWYTLLFCLVIILVIIIFYTSLHKSSIKLKKK